MARSLALCLLLAAGASAAPVPKGVKVDPLLGSWVIVSGAPPCAEGYDTLRVRAGDLWYESLTRPDSGVREYEVEDGNCLVLDGDYRIRMEYVIDPAGGVLTVRICYRGEDNEFVLRRER